MCEKCTKNDLLPQHVVDFFVAYKCMSMSEWSASMYVSEFLFICMCMQGLSELCFIIDVLLSTFSHTHIMSECVCL